MICLGLVGRMIRRNCGIRWWNLCEKFHSNIFRRHKRLHFYSTCYRFLHTDGIYVFCIYGIYGMLVYIGVSYVNNYRVAPATNRLHNMWLHSNFSFETLDIFSCHRSGDNLHREWQHKQGSCQVCGRYRALFRAETADSSRAFKLSDAQDVRPYRGWGVRPCRGVMAL